MTVWQKLRKEDLKEKADHMEQTYREYMIEDEWEKYCKTHEIGGNIDFLKSLKKKENNHDRK